MLSFLKKNKGFSLTELLVSILIFSFFATAFVISSSNSIKGIYNVKSKTSTNYGAQSTIENKLTTADVNESNSTETSVEFIFNPGTPSQTELTVEGMSVNITDSENSISSSFEAFIPTFGETIVTPTPPAGAATATPTVSATATPTASVTATPTPTNIPGATNTPTPTATNTPTPTPAFTPISGTVISGVTIPVHNTNQLTTVTSTSEYTATLTWSPIESSGKFGNNTTYTATITITPKSGYTLTGVSANQFTVTGATSTTNAANSGTVTAVFPKT